MQRQVVVIRDGLVGAFYSIPNGATGLFKQPCEAQTVKVLGIDIIQIKLVVGLQRLDSGIHARGHGIP